MFDDDNQEQIQRNASTLATAISEDLLAQLAREQAYSPPSGSLETDSRGRPVSIKLHQQDQTTDDLKIQVRTDSWGRNATLTLPGDNGQYNVATANQGQGRDAEVAVDRDNDGKPDSLMQVRTDSWGRSPEILIDKDKDGTIDARVKVKSDNWGRPASIAIDMDNDGTFDFQMDVTTDSWGRNLSFKPSTKSG